LEPEKEHASQHQSSLWLPFLLGILVSSLAYLKIKPVDSQRKQINSETDTTHGPSKPIPVLASEPRVPQTVSHYEKPSEKRSKVPDWLKFVVNVLTLAAVVWYACEARKQRVAMDNTFTEVHDQTTYLHQQLVATQAATLGYHFDVYFAPPKPSGLRSFVDYVSGTGMASNVHMDGEASWVTFPKLRVISTQPFHFIIPQIRREDSAVTRVNTIPLKGVTVEAWLPLDVHTVDKTIKIEGTFSYNNGFDPVPAQAFCVVWYSHAPITGGPLEGSAQGFVSCSELEAQMSYFALLEKNAAQAQKH
jgi:hypothetical protein